MRDLQRILDEGRATTTYKYALLAAIGELCVEHGDDSGASLRLAHDLIAERVIALYWPQARPYTPAEVRSADRVEDAGIYRYRGGAAAVLR